MANAKKAEKSAALEKLLLERLEAIESGDATGMTSKDWQNLKEDLVRRHGKKGQI